MTVWESLALSTDESHFLSSYGEQSSSALMYNLFSDLLLGTNIVPQSVCVTSLTSPVGGDLDYSTVVSKSNAVLPKSNEFGYVDGITLMEEDRWTRSLI